MKKYHDHNMLWSYIHNYYTSEWFIEHGDALCHNLLSVQMKYAIWINFSCICAASATVDIDTALQSVSDDTMCVASAYSNVSSTSQMTLSNVARTMATVARVESVMLNTTATTSSARSLLSDANAALVERSTLLDQIASEQKNVSDLYQVALSELSDLRSRLETIKQAAARVSHD